MTPQIDKDRCAKVADIIRSLRFRESFMKRPYLNMEADDETKLRAYLFSSAICHQTHSLWSKAKNRKGWEYLEDVYAELANKKDRLLDTDYLTTLQPKELAEQLAPLFSDDKTKENCTLDRLEERASFIIDISKMLKVHYNGRISDLITLSDNHLINNGNGIYELLEKFEAFSDPSRKKSTVFIKVSMDSGVLKLKDPINLIPMMDYHMMRVLMRMGCVEVDDELRQKLIDHTKLESDKDIRDACIEAQILIAKMGDLIPIKMNDVFWPLGRSCCHEVTLCHDKHCKKDPCTFAKTVQLDSHKECIFENVCKAAKDKTYRMIWQPIVDTHFY